MQYYTKRYVITKSSRKATKISYSGSSWDLAGIRHLYQASYDNKETAETYARKLSEYNPVGFEVVVHNVPLDERNVIIV